MFNFGEKMTIFTQIITNKEIQKTSQKGQSDIRLGGTKTESESGKQTKPDLEGL